MTAKQKITMALAYAGMTQTELARRLDISPQLLHKRIATGKFTLEEWEKLAEAMGAEADIRIRFKDGKEI